MQARIERERCDRIYRIYVTDALKSIGGFDERYYDFITANQKPTDNRTAEEIIDDLKGKLNALAENNDERI